MNKEEQIITEYNEEELDLVEDKNVETDTKNDNMHQEIKDFSDSVSSVRVTISEAKPFGDQPYASDHI